MNNDMHVNRLFRNNKTGEMVRLIEIKEKKYMDICVYANKSTGDVNRDEKGYFFLTHTKVEES